jgi:hypothetical protein
MSRLIIGLVLLTLSACAQPPPASSTIGRACAEGKRGCLPAYPAYEVERPLRTTSQPGMTELKQGQMAVCH